MSRRPGARPRAPEPKLYSSSSTTHRPSWNPTMCYRASCKASTQGWSCAPPQSSWPPTSGTTLPATLR
jgi:hypothetical protein